MSKRKLAFLFVILALAGLLAFPTLLKAIPPRYAARLPEPLRQIAEPRDVVPILPTAARPLAANDLLQITEPNGVTAVTLNAPPTLTPLPITEQTPEPPLPTLTHTPTVTPIPLPQSVRLEGIRHQFQEWNNCGPATLAMTLSFFGMALTQSQTAAVLKPNPEDRNVSPEEMVAYVNNETDLAAITRANGDLYTVRRLLANEIPVILEIGIDPPGEFRWLGWYGHYLLVVAYDDALQQFWVYDSWFGTSEVPLENASSEGRAVTYDQVAEYWPHFNRNYIAVYRPEQAGTVAEIIGEEMDDAVMWQKALVDIRGETAVSPDNAFLWFNLGTIYNALGQYERAATAFDQARSIGLPWRMLWYQFGPYEAYLQVGRYEDVILLADTTLKDRPYFEESFYYKGLAHAAQGETDIARDNLEKAVRFNPNFEPAAIALAEIGD